MKKGDGDYVLLIIEALETLVETKFSQNATIDT